MFLVDRELKEVLQKGTVRIFVDEDVFPPFDSSTQIGPSSIESTILFLFCATCLIILKLEEVKQDKK